MKIKEVSQQRVAVWLVAAAAILLRLFAYAPFDLSHADELMQYLEQANRLVTGTGVLPWESRVGLRNSIIPQILALPVWLGHVIGPGTLTPVHLARLTFMALTLSSLLAAWRLGTLLSWRHAFVAIFVTAIWWESILFSNLLLSESLASGVLLLASATLLDRQADRQRAAAAAFLLGCSALLRLQYAPFAAVLFAWTLARDRSRWPYLFGGGLLSVGLGVVSDLCAGMVPYSWVIVNFQKNIGDGIAARFGTSPAWQYLYDYYLHFGPGALLFVVIAALASGARYRPLLVAAAVNVAVHSLILHKEYRFVWASTLALLVLAAIGSLRIIEHLLEERGKIEWLGWRSVLAVALGWALLSITSYNASGGYKAYRGGGELSRLAVSAAERPEVCRLAVVEAYYSYVVPSILPRKVPISIAPKGVYELNRPLPIALRISANALLAERRPIGAEAYRQVSCLKLSAETACLYIRPGGCGPDTTYDFQASLIRAGV